jgi:hypothetical protein
MKRAVAVLLSIYLAMPALAADEVVVFKGRACGCCLKWIDHLRGAGFEARGVNVSRLSAVQARFSVPQDLRSCHTAVVAGYVIEGHVPAADIRRLLRERPTIAGLAAPGMPLGSPGMEGRNSKPYRIMSFTKDGTVAHYATHPPSE